jgi:DNA (cytosine-5)-methyltransferase 1
MKKPKAYYNEIDTKCCDWLQSLMDQGLIMAGKIDNRSIHDVTPDDLLGFTRVGFFAGIAGWELALQLAGWPEDRPVWHGSCPCQPFSTAGKQLGDKDERHLWPVFFNLIKECRPEYVLGEQVASAIGKGWLDGVSTDLGKEGYACGSAVLGAHSLSSPHIRQRLYWVAYDTSAGLEGSTRQELQGDGRGLAWSSEASGVAYSGSEGCNRSQRSREAGTQRTPSGHSSECSSSNAWSNCTIIPCRDGKSRRIPAQAIIEPVFQHVVDGFSCSLDARRNILNAAQGFPLAETIPGRVALLKGAGNAIVPQVAAEFIAAFMDIEATETALFH